MKEKTIAPSDDEAGWMLRDNIGLSEYRLELLVKAIIQTYYTEEIPKIKELFQSDSINSTIAWKQLLNNNYTLTKKKIWTDLTMLAIVAAEAMWPIDRVATVLHKDNICP